MKLLAYLVQHITAPHDVTLCDCGDDTFIAEYFARHDDDEDFTDSDACRIVDRCTIYFS